MYRFEAVQAITAQRVFGIVRAADEQRAVAAARASLGAGLRAVEVTLTGTGALSAIRRLAADAPEGSVIGAGTVLDEASARLAVEAGARFLVSPNLRADVIRTGHRYGVPVFPGVATPTEVAQALELGADAVKLFPAAAYQPRWIADVRAALPQAPIIPTGGVTVGNAAEWIAAGALACGIGSALTSGGPDEAASRVKALLENLATAG